MRRAKAAPSDPLFAAEVQGIAEARRATERGRTGHGRVVGKDGPEPLDPDGPFARNNAVPHLGPGVCVSVFRPSGDAR